MSFLLTPNSFSPSLDHNSVHTHLTLLNKSDVFDLDSLEKILKKLILEQMNNQREKNHLQYTIEVLYMQWLKSFLNHESILLNETNLVVDICNELLQRFGEHVAFGRDLCPGPSRR
jgi:hypothetical protein